MYVFGILLEMSLVGGMPFPSLAEDKEVARVLARGTRPDRLMECPDPFFS